MSSTQRRACVAPESGRHAAPGCAWLGAIDDETGELLAGPHLERALDELFTLTDDNSRRGP